LLLPGINGLNIVYGISPEFAMSYIDESVHPELHLFVEDKEANTLLRDIIASHNEGSVLLPRLSFSNVGPANVVKVMGELGSNHKLPYKSIGVLDGEMEESPGCIILPGKDAPERVIFNQLRIANWENLPERFGIGAGQLFTIFEDAMFHPDHHEWTSIIGNRTRMSSNRVWEIMAKEWCTICLSDADRDRIIQQIKDRLS